MAGVTSQAVAAGARASLWLQPHRIGLVAVGLALVVCAALFMRWDWLPDYYGLALQGIWRTLWILAVTCMLGFMLALLFWTKEQV